MESGPDMNLNQNLYMTKLDISNKIHNKSNILFNAQIWKTVRTIIIREISSSGRIVMVDTQVTYFLFMLAFLSNF